MSQIGTAVGGTAVGLANRPQSTLPELIDQINQRIGAIEARQGVIRDVLERLLSPRPTAVPSNNAKELKPDLANHEAALQAIIRRLDSVQQTAEDQSDTLNSAV